MGIVRVSKDKNFVVMDKTGLEDERLSFKAKGLLAYLLSKPDNWYCYDKHLAKVGPDGKTAVNSGLKELKKYGYLEKKPIRGKDGKIQEWESIIREVPKSLLEQESDQNPENLDSGKPRNRESGVLNKELYKINNDYKEEEEGKNFKNKISQKTLSLFKQVYGQNMQPYQLKLIKEYGFSEEIIQKALKLAGLHNAQTLQYLLDILADWKKEEVTNLQEVEELIQRFKNPEEYYAHKAESQYR